jgi:CTP:molybdopterin cytidylyltransferase MocA
MLHRPRVRTTLTLDEDVYEAAARQAASRRLSLGKVVSDLMRKGMQAPARVREQDGVVIFDLPADSPEVTMETVKRLESETR